MAISYPVLDIPGGIAGVTFASGLTGLNSTGQYLFVKMHTENPDVGGTAFTFSPCTATSDDPIGIAQNNPASGAGLAVRALGLSKCMAGGTVRAGDEIGTDAAGRGVVIAATSTGANYGRHVCGVAMEGAASGELFTIALIRHYRVH